LSEVGNLEALQIAKESAAILRDIGRSLRRVKSKETLGKDGLRVVWHQGKLRTDLSSWETEAHEIRHQELAFFNQMIEFRQGSSLRTGTLPQAPDESLQLAPKSALFVPHRQADVTVLEAASSILRACPKRDYFTQHLLKEVNSALNQAQKNSRKTQVMDLHVFRALAEVRAEEAAKPPPSRMRYKTAIAVIACGLAAAAVAFFLRR
jgi:hypothetical protein